MSTTISGTNGVTFPDSTSMQTGQQACKAWVNFNGTGTVAIRGSYNVSSITDYAAGRFGLNFATAMPDANYSISGLASRPNLGGSHTPRIVDLDEANPPTASVCKITTDYAAGTTGYDTGYTTVAVFSN